MQPYNDQHCPICEGACVGRCRCHSHDIASLVAGHGMTCENGHRWSTDRNGKIISYDPSKSLAENLSDLTPEETSSIKKHFEKVLDIVGEHQKPRYVAWIQELNRLGESTREMPSHPVQTIKLRLEETTARDATMSYPSQAQDASGGIDVSGGASGSIEPALDTVSSHFDRTEDDSEKPLKKKGRKRMKKFAEFSREDR